MIKIICPKGCGWHLSLKLVREGKKEDYEYLCERCGYSVKSLDEIPDEDFRVGM